MGAKYADQEIETMITEPKSLPSDYRSRVQLRDKRGHKERELGIEGQSGNQYRLILRQSQFNVLDFSLILAVCPKETNQVFRLRRYNGKSHEHSNPIEQNSFYDFHIHIATERYQELGVREDTFAEPSDRFSDFNAALKCLIEDCRLDAPPDPQGLLFEET